jgi:hypothetical protein
MVYPGAGIANSTGTAWGTSYTTTGTGTVVALATSPTFVTPILGTPTSGTLTNCTGYTYANLSGTVPTWNQNTTGTAAGLSATLAVASGGTGVTTSTGTGNNVLSTSPTFVTPILGTPTSGTLTNCTFPTLNQNTTGSSGSCTGNAATASNASLLNSISAVNLYNNMGQVHSTSSSFDAQGAALTRDFGYRYVQGSTNGPGTNGASQYYAWNIGLGSDYAYNTYAAQFALPRDVTTPYLSVRYEEGGALKAWQKIAAGYADSAGTATSATTATTATNLAGAVFSTGSTGYYTIRSSGLIIQWGQATLGANTSTTTNYAITFPTASLATTSGSPIGATSGTSGWAPSGACPNNTSSARIWNTDDSTNTIWYIAVGY